MVKTQCGMRSAWQRLHFRCERVRLDEFIGQWKARKHLTK
ncbi:hypothetical protein HMPREF0004_0289 [Achromobacter piechaudii ATCC 43553]|uniref:Uncharacterized protein n=1 Tax=Achromobacter piechaudii ATCC 43553 TaxID=742159 RepID=D4X492_9BURK|nr:hypothetical protein HMPREF0004_0289 [Achromobacter piechaudii ATCC 43553]